jgi:hypothetical protein
VLYSTDYPAGQELATLLVGCKGISSFVFGLWDYQDQFSGGPNEVFFLNAVDYALDPYSCNTNAPPVASCLDVTVSADANCQANANVDNGSYDPDGDVPLTISQSPPGPYSVGITAVTLTVDDGNCGSDQCTATVTVADSVVRWRNSHVRC